MNNIQKRIINRVIARIYLTTKSEGLRLYLLNYFSRLFVDRNNRIEFDSENEIFWLRNRNQYLPPVKNGNFFFNVNRFEKSFEEYFCKKYQPKEGDVIIDLGAGVGEEVYYFKKKIHSSGKLFSIEASPENFKSLELISQKYNWENSFNFNIAIADYDGFISIEENDFYLLKKVCKKDTGVKIPCFTLDSFVKNNGIRKIDFLKVNIEGFELEILDGMKESISIIQNAAISCHDFLNLPGKENIKKSVAKYFVDNGFEISYNNSGNIITDSWIYAKKFPE